MKITEAIEKLDALRLKYGNVEVKFDCPFCYRTTVPSVITPVAVSVLMKISE